MKGNKGMVVAIVVIVAMSFLVLDSLAANHMVGGSNRVYGWSWGNIGSFPFEQGTVIRAGDTLVFKYDNTKHNVVSVGYSDYANCQANPGQRWNSGYDKITVSYGQYYFLSTFDKDCSEGGMRFGINVGGLPNNATPAEQAP